MEGKEGRAGEEQGKRGGWERSRQGKRGGRERSRERGEDGRGAGD
jgi:hypothetical protein